MDNAKFYLAFHYCPGIGPKTFTLIEKVFEQDLEKAWQSSKSDWQRLNFSAKIIENIFTFKTDFNFKQILENLAKLEIKYLARDNAAFPPLLKQIADCPIGLFIKGQILPCDHRALAVVGTRKITVYGQEITKKFVGNLTNLGFTIVSGLARGVDGLAHKIALENGGRTIAVLGNGLESIYPPEHRSLALQIIKNGALISEYPPFTKITPGNFPARNRIISGMSLGILVTEGSHKSGSKITALQALEQNREVFAVPGPITSEMSQAPSELIQMGAKLVLSEKDILEELNLTALPKNGERLNLDKQNYYHFDDQVQTKIYESLIQGNKHIDDLVRFLKLDPASILTSLTMMELRGYVKNLGNGHYMIN
ncbi:DNA-protecting protein DprA [Candidatus Beckwithbacteria bacterium]|nr:DNA-protecting protein DprA [Candidatus Beckwithbacteria bacterium]